MKNFIKGLAKIIDDEYCECREKELRHKTKDGHDAFIDKRGRFKVVCPTTGRKEHQYEVGHYAHCFGCEKRLFKFGVKTERARLGLK